MCLYRVRGGFQRPPLCPRCSLTHRCRCPRPQLAPGSDGDCCRCGSQTCKHINTGMTLPKKSEKKWEPAEVVCKRELPFMRSYIISECEMNFWSASVVFLCTCPGATLPLPSASGQSEWDLHVPRRRTPPYRQPTPPGSLVVWWRRASLKSHSYLDLLHLDLVVINPNASMKTYSAGSVFGFSRNIVSAD